MPVGPLELGIILIIIIIIFGVGKLPQIGGALGQGIREFRESQRAADEVESSTPPAQIDSQTTTTTTTTQAKPQEPAKEEL
ncbi:MAG TPA: twin-arginine translocase TatA/TatE family subunit [Thermomicrobiales bacterium]|nr:twin-arginine translocase TatA/TatE family subunit [Thermomicrobiales bacterium]